MQKFKICIFYLIINNLIIKIYFIRYILFNSLFNSLYNYNNGNSRVRSIIIVLCIKN